MSDAYLLEMAFHTATTCADLVRVKDVTHDATQPVVACKVADIAAHDAPGFPRTQPLAVTVMREFQQIAAFKCIKHSEPSDMACSDGAQKIVNIPLTSRTMEAWHA